MKLEIGYNASFEIRKEVYFSDRCATGFSVLYLSDLHLNRAGGNLVQALIATLKLLDPSIILFGGDYVDSRAGLVHLQTLLKALAGRKHLFAIGGNHDSFFGAALLQEMFLAHNVSWLREQPSTICLGSAKIEISPDFKAPVSPEAPDFSILLLHRPVPLEKFQERYELAFAGHLHGCQAVLWKRKESLFPGRLFYRWNRLKAAGGACRYYISKGLGDTLPIRYNCKKDLLFVTVKSTRPQNENPTGC